MTTTYRLPHWLVGQDARPFLIGAVLLVVGYLPLFFLGPGTDLDVGGVYQAGRAILDGHYEVSRTPGAPVFEGATGLLQAIGGTVLVNAASMVMAVVTALAVVRLLDMEGVARASWLGLAVLVNPFVWIAGTSMVDFMWALGFALCGAVFQRSRSWLPALCFYGLAAGCRLSTLLLIGAFLLGDFLIASPAHRRWLVKLGVSVLVVTAAVFLAPFLSLGSRFLHSDVEASTLLVQLGRFGVKSWYFFGPLMIGLVIWTTFRNWRGLPRTWLVSPVFRMATFGAVATQLLFLRYPWKLAHLIPVFVCFILMLGAAQVSSRNVVGFLLLSQLVLGLVNLNLADPDRPDHATGGTLAPQLMEGPLLTDVRCRLDSDREAYRRPKRDNEGGVGTDLLETWACVVPWSE